MLTPFSSNKPLHHHCIINGCASVETSCKWAIQTGKNRDATWGQPVRPHFLWWCVSWNFRRLVKFIEIGSLKKNNKSSGWPDFITHQASPSGLAVPLIWRWTLAQRPREESPKAWCFGRRASGDLDLQMLELEGVGPPMRPFVLQSLKSWQNGFPANDWTNRRGPKRQMGSLVQTGSLCPYDHDTVRCDGKRGHGCDSIHGGLALRVGLKRSSFPRRALFLQPALG